jgi:hypothetical protein
MASTIVCEIEFNDSQMNNPMRVVGRVLLSQIFDKKNSWITLVNKCQQDEKWSTQESLIHKPDIIKITFLSANCYISINKRDLGTYSSSIPQASERL